MVWRRRKVDEVNVDSYVLEVDEVNVDSFADKTGKCSVPGCEPQLHNVQLNCRVGKVSELVCLLWAELYVEKAPSSDRSVIRKVRRKAAS